MYITTKEGNQISFVVPPPAGIMIRLSGPAVLSRSYTQIKKKLKKKKKQQQ